MKSGFFRKAWRIAPLLLAGVLVLTSCGPVYRTHYDFHQPPTEEGRRCVFQCQTAKLQCEQIEDMRMDRCLDREERKQARCFRRMEQAGEEIGPYDCQMEDCEANYERCDAGYRACFQACGGTIDKEVVCVSNCE
jgi:hypothetical protein